MFLHYIIFLFVVCNGATVDNSSSEDGNNQQKYLRNLWELSSLKKIRISGLSNVLLLNHNAITGDVIRWRGESDLELFSSTRRRCLEMLKFLRLEVFDYDDPAESEWDSRFENWFKNKPKDRVLKILMDNALACKEGLLTDLEATFYIRENEIDIATIKKAKIKMIDATIAIDNVLILFAPKNFTNNKNTLWRAEFDGAWEPLINFPFGPQIDHESITSLADEEDKIAAFREFFNYTQFTIKIGPEVIPRLDEWRKLFLRKKKMGFFFFKNIFLNKIQKSAKNKPKNAIFDETSTVWETVKETMTQAWEAADADWQQKFLTNLQKVTCQSLISTAAILSYGYQMKAYKNRGRDLMLLLRLNDLLSSLRIYTMHVPRDMTDVVKQYLPQNDESQDLQGWEVILLEELKNCGITKSTATSELFDDVQLEPQDLLRERMENKKNQGKIWKEIRRIVIKTIYILICIDTHIYTLI
eukprot:GHVL01030526.1.p1 GENE.GHVL01030526.1~~GHVL01030526.1.p1  ORF type:complete len:471 (-),score=71.71 GHVL01030526.1:1790-3202(-)